MKKKFTFLLAALALLTMIVQPLKAVAESETIVFANLGLENGVQYLDPFGTNISVTFGGGDNDGKYYTTGSGIRTYGNGTITITANGKTVTGVSTTFSGANYAPASADVWSCTGGTGTGTSGIDASWSGSATQIVMTRPSGSGHWRLQSITVNYSTGGTPTVATPTFSPAAGLYTSAQNVTISTTTTGATIYYTTDGTDPTTSSSVFSSSNPISVSTNTTIKAMATASGHNNSSIATAHYYFVEHAGTATDPYSVADARTAIDANSGITNVYATGIVCTGGSNLSNGALNYWISDDGTQTNRLEAYKGKGIGGADFTSTNDVQVGDVVVIKGNLTKYNSTYEFAQDNELVSLTHKAITVDQTAINLTYIQGNGPASVDLAITGNDLTDPFTATITQETPAFEMTDGINTGTSLTIPAAGDLIEVRLKAGLSHGDYTGTLTLHSEELSNDVVVTLTGSVTNQTYDIVVTQPSAGGTIEADKEFAEAGATVTLTATPEAAYDFGSWTVLKDDMVTPVAVENNQFTMPACDVLVTATFTAKPTYAITLDYDDTHALMEATPASAYQGQTVTLTIVPEDGYALDALTATYVGSDSNTHHLTITNNTFVMPAYPVTVTATFMVSLEITYDFSTVNEFYTTSALTEHPATGNTNHVDEIYYSNGNHFTITRPTGGSSYFGNGYFLLGKTNAMLNLPTFTNYNVTSIVIHSSTGHSKSVRVAIFSGEDLVANEQLWDTQDKDYIYTIPVAYQQSALSVKVLNNYNTQFTSITLVREVPSTDPAIAVEPSTVDLPTYSATNGTLTVTASNFELTDVTASGVEYYEYDNVYDEYVTASKPSWLTVTCSSPYSTVGYSVEANDGAARTAYFKVRLTHGTNDDEVRSNLVAITQAEFVMDFVTLPFDYMDEEVLANGLDAIPTGLTQNGLGTYTSNSTPRLKFDDTGDWLVLKVNEALTSLSYDIKGNGFDGSTFTVQTSEDGVTYTDMDTYTTIAGSSTTVTHVDLASTVRYIKWIYTHKFSGNVALGNIHASTNYDIYGNVTVGHLNIPIDKVCTIYSGATLTIGIDGLSNEGNATNLIIKDGGQLYTPSAVSGTVEKNITGYGSSTATNGYYLVSAPAKTMMTWTEHTDAYHFDAYYPEEEWRNIRQATGPWHISADTPALYASQEDRTLSFNGYGVNAGTVVNSDLPATNAEIDVPVKFNDGKPFQGLNLIGNPYTCKAYLVGNLTFYRMNTNGDGFISATGAINVCEGVFVETTSGQNNVTFTTTAPDANAGNNNSMINISLSQVVNRGEQTLVDNALIRFSEGNTMHKFSLSDNTAKVYFTEGNQDYAVIRSEARGEMPVNFKAAETGTYTLSVEAENLDVEYLHLIDNMTGMDVDLLQTPSYTFEGKRSDYASRFRLVFSANTANENDDFAFISNGQIILNNIDADATVQIIDALGRMITSANANNRVSTDNMAAGVYVLRLINGNDVKTQKIVVR